MMVIGLHLWQAGALGQGTLARLAIAGQTGVDVFFVLSGFLITRILLSNRGVPGQLGRFYLRRSLRIFPLYYAGLLLYLVIVPILSGGRPVPLSQSWWFTVYLQAIPMTLPGHVWAGPVHFWSLAVEEHFYLVWPWVVAFVHPRRLPWVAIAVVALSLATRWTFVHIAGLSAFFATPCRLDGLAFGALLASAERGDLPSGVTRMLRERSGAFCAVVALAMLLYWGLWSQSGSAVLAVYKYTAISLFFGLAMSWIVLGGDERRLAAAAFTILSCAPARAVGRISYGLYVYHPACIILLRLWWPHAAHAWFMAAVLLATFAISWASFRWMERPILGLRDFPTKPADHTPQGP